MIYFSEYCNATMGMFYNTAPFDYTGHPSLSLNVGYQNGLPVGAMLVGKMFDDITVLKIAHFIEKAMKEYGIP